MIDVKILSVGDRVLALTDAQIETELEVHHTFNDGFTSHAVLFWVNQFGQRFYVVRSGPQIIRRVQ